MGWKDGIWKWNIAPKFKCFWWLVIHNAILTWDNLSKRGIYGPSRCVLCSDDTEDINHLFVFCRFTKYIWSCLAHYYNFAWAWDDLPVRENFANWHRLQHQRLHFPILVCWIMWNNRNRIIFDHHKLSASTIIYQISQLYGLYPDKKHLKKRQSKILPQPDTWAQNIATFDGASQGGICGGGGTITLLDHRTIHYKVGLGAGTNTRAELLSLWALLTLARRLDCNELQVFGDSQVIVDWMNGKNVIKNAALNHWYQRTVCLRDTFAHITLEHFYREYNMATDSLSKDGINMEEGIMWYKDASNVDTGGWDILNNYTT